MGIFGVTTPPVVRPPLAPDPISIWDGRHPIWKLAQQGLQLGLAIFLASHGAIDHLTAAHPAHLDGTDALGAAWLLRELIALHRP